MSKLTAIRKQIAALEARAQRIAKSEMAPAIAKVKAIMADFNLTIEHLTQAVTSKTAAKKVKAKAASVAKYADPKTGKQWSGFGRAPGWIAGAKNRDAFLTDKSGIKAAEPNAKAVAPAKKAAAKVASTASKPAAKKSAKKAAKQAAPAVKKTVPAVKKGAASAKKAAPPAKKALSAAKKVAPAAKKVDAVAATDLAAKKKPLAKKPAAKKVAANKATPKKTAPKSSAVAPAPAPVETLATPTA